MTLVCKACGSKRHKVTDSRPRNNTIMRVRCCIDCDERTRTYEIDAAVFEALYSVSDVVKGLEQSLAASATALRHVVEDYELRAPAPKKPTRRS